MLPVLKKLKGQDVKSNSDAKRNKTFKMIVTTTIILKVLFQDRFTLVAIHKT